MNLTAYKLEDLELMEPRPEEESIVEMERSINSWRLHGPAFTLWDDAGKAVGAAGVIVLRDGFGEAWFRGTPRVLEHAIPVARMTQVFIEAIIRDHKLVRLQAFISTERPKAIQFAEWLGFECEGLCRRYGVNREDYYLYARITEARN